MTLVGRPVGVSLVAAISAFGVLSAFGQLNPTVKVLPKAQSPVPAECAEGLAPAAPRVIIAEAQPPAVAPANVPAPPSTDLKGRLRRLQIAAEGDDRDEFEAALADAKTAVAAYPLGGERDVANDVIQVYSDLARLWDYAFSSPTGSFFDSTSENGALLTMMRRYPDYAKSISDSTLNVGGQIVYPTRETRRFLAAEASKRLGRLGLRTAARVTTPPPRTPEPQPRVMQPAKPKPKPKPVQIAHRQVTHRAPKPKKIAEATPPPGPPIVSTPTTTAAPAPVKPSTSKTPTTATTASEATASEATASEAPPPTTTTATAATTSTTATEAPPFTTAETSETTATQSTAPQKPQESGGRMNLLFAIILIVIGIGVLIVLFRASD
jgi:hypothetical protein